MCIFEEWTGPDGSKEENVRQMLNEYEKDRCKANDECTCAEILTRCMFGPDHRGEFVT